MPGSNEGNEGNEGNAGSLGAGGGGGFGVLPDRVDLPFVTQGKVADQRLYGTVWNDRSWAGEWAAWLMLVDFAQAVKLPYARPQATRVTHMTRSGAGNGTCVLDAKLPVIPGARPGTYVLRFTKTGSHSGSFELKGPGSNQPLGTYSLPGIAGGAVSISNEINLVITDGATDFGNNTKFEIWVSPSIMLPGLVTAAMQDAANKGSCTLDAAQPVLPGFRPGTYQLRCTAPNGTGGTFTLQYPDGTNVIGNIVLPPGGQVSVAQELNFVLTAGIANFAANDGYDITIRAGDVPWIDGPDAFQKAPVTTKASRLTSADKGICLVRRSGSAALAAKYGRYTLDCIAAPQNGGTFRVTDPSGAHLGDLILPGTDGGAGSLDNQFTFIVTDGALDFSMGEAFHVDATPVGIIIRKDRGNVGNGTLALSPDPQPVLERWQAMPGRHRVRCTNASMGDFLWTRPDGTTQALRLSGTAAGGSATSAPGALPKFTITAGATAFAAGDGWDILVDNDVLELRDLVNLAEDERADALGEILAQSDGFIAYFLAAAGISPRTHPNTCRLLHVGSLLGAYVSMHFKGLYQRRRPSQRAPGLMPPIPVPGHPAYPSGHSTQAHLMALCVRHALPDDIKAELGLVLDELADRIARNREIAGLHYASDSAAGKELAGQILGLLISDTLVPATLPQSIPPAPWNPTQQRFAKLVDDAKAEWS